MNRQRGFMMYVYLAVALFVMAAGAAVVMKYTSAIARAENAEQSAQKLSRELQASQVENTRLQGDLNAAKELAAERAAQRNAGAAHLKLVLDALARLKVASPEVVANLATPVHPAVRSMRRSTYGCDPDPKVQCTPRRLPTNDATAATRRDDGGANRGERGSTQGP